MLSGMVFGRRKPGGNGGVSANSDMLMSKINEREGRDCLSIRIHGDVMRRLRWMYGDYVVLKPNDDGTQWTVERVGGPKHGGMKLTSASGKSSNHANVRFTIDQDVLEEVFNNGETSFTCTLRDSSGNEAVFVKD